MDLRVQLKVKQEGTFQNFVSNTYRPPRGLSSHLLVQVCPQAILEEGGSLVAQRVKNLPAVQET